MEKTEVLKYCRDEVKLPFLVPYDLSTVFELPKVEDESKARFKMVEGDRRKIRLKIVQHESGLKGILFIDGFVYEEAVSKKKKIKWINKAIFDFIMLSFERYSLDELKAHKSEIVELLKNLPNEDDNFLHAISSGTSEKNNLNYRLNTWLQKMDVIING